MALGNANTSAQARGKAKPVIVKRRKEVVLAKNYTEMAASTVQSRAACGFTGTLSETLYHNGSSSVPTTGDTVYSRRRVNSKYGLKTGHYKVQISSRTYNIQITSDDGVIAAVTTCR